MYVIYVIYYIPLLRFSVFNSTSNRPSNSRPRIIQYNVLNPGSIYLASKTKMSEFTTKKTQQPPATPTYILRGHAAPIHALHLFANNLRLISGDAEGWIVIWDMVSKRPVASWKAHAGAVLEAKGLSEGTGDTTVVYT